QAVYFGAREVMPAGCPVRLTVDHLEKRRRARNDHWPWVVQAFTPRHENYPVFNSASVTLPDGTETPLEVSFLSIANEREVHALAPKGSLAAGTSSPGKAPSPASADPIVTFEAAIRAGDTLLTALPTDAAADRES